MLPESMLFLPSPEKKSGPLFSTKTPTNRVLASYDESLDALRIRVKPKKAKEKMEKMTFDIKNNGKVSLVLADTSVEFLVKETKKKKK